MERTVCGDYAGATPWLIWSDENPADLADRLAVSAGCAGYTVDGVYYAIAEHEECPECWTPVEPGKDCPHCCPM